MEIRPTRTSVDFESVLDDAALTRASSPAIFQRGQVYARSGAVQVLEEAAGEAPALRATVTGTQPYEVEVRIEQTDSGAEVRGDCDCPNAQDGWFCKHQVALALALVWRGRLGGEVPAVDEAARKKVAAVAKRARTVAQRHEDLAAFLRGQSPEALAGRLLALAERDAAIERELQQWRALSDVQQGPARLPELKALVTKILTPGRDFLDWQQASVYARRATAVLPLLAQTRARSVDEGLALALHAMRRGWAALARADDSNGHLGELVQAIGGEWVAALSSAGQRPAAFGESYLDLCLDDPMTSFDRAAAEAAIGAAALARFDKCLAQRWRAAQDLASAARAAQAAKAGEAHRQRRRVPVESRIAARDGQLWLLRHLYLARLEARGDIDGALAVLREDLPDVAAFRQVTTFLERHDRLREAFANAEAGLRAFPDDDRMQEDMLRCYERDGWIDEALVLARRRFEQRPGVERYQRVMRVGTAAGREAASLRAELQALLVAHETEAVAQTRSWLPHAGPDVTLRVEVLCMEARWSEALAAVRPPARCRIEVLCDLARHLGEEHAAQRVELLQRALRSSMLSATSPYRDELELVREICRLLDPAQRDRWLHAQRVEYKAKRNFVGGLPGGA